jgi:hypothetical protein
VICETCSGARFSEEGYPHHLTEMDECLCGEPMRRNETKPVTDEARAMLERLEVQLSPMRYRTVCREALEMARGEQVTGWAVVSALESVRTHRQ